MDSASNYLEPTDPDAFVDFPVVSDIPEDATICPKCKGHGGWNLRLNAYPLHNYDNIPENRHRFSHFRAACGACWSWGYLQPGQTCVHEWSHYRNIGNCLNEWKCTICGQIREVDSSG
jgi:hypothetical protein